MTDQLGGRIHPPNWVPDFNFIPRGIWNDSKKNGHGKGQRGLKRFVPEFLWLKVAPAAFALSPLSIISCFGSYLGADKLAALRCHQNDYKN